MATEFKLPPLGEGVDQADVSRVFVQEGDEIDADQPVMELETEKAVTDLPCPHAGKIAKLHVSEGDTIKVDQVLLTIEAVKDDDDRQQDAKDADADKADEKEQDETSDQKGAARDQPAAEVTPDDAPQDAERDDPREAQPRESAKAQERGEQRASDEEKDDREEKDEDEETGDDDREERSGESRERDEADANGSSAGDGASRAADRTPPPAGPATRRLARKLDVDLAGLQPGDGNRIRPEEVVRAYVASGKADAVAEQDLPDFERFGPVERVPQNRLAQTAARRLRRSWRLVPQVTQHGSADITDLEAARRTSTEKAGASQAKITLTTLAIKAAVGALKQLPDLNASLDTERHEVVRKHYFHIGVAVATDRGLVVPVIRDADRKNLDQLATELENLADRARRGRLSADAMQGATFTVSNQGGIGGGHFTPLVNWPEVAILGLGAAHARCVLRGGAPAERWMLPLSVSYDHRVINGADAARFMRILEESLSGTFALLRNG